MFLALLTALPLLAGGADDPPPAEGPGVVELLRGVRSRHADADERRAAIEGLLALGPEGALPLGIEIQRQCRRLGEDWDDAREDVLDGFEKAAPQLVKRRLDTRTRDEIEELAERVRVLSRDGALSKQTIVEVSDPARGRIEEVLEVSPADVWAADEDLALEFVEALELADASEALRADWLRARDLLAADPGSELSLRRLEAPRDLSAADEGLLDELRRLAILATPMSSRDARVLEANAAITAELAEQFDPQEVLGIRHMNLLRIRLGLGALAIDPKLCVACRDHSKDMVELGFFSHTSPVEGKETFGQRAALAGTTASAENIAAGQSTGVGAIEAWWHSPGHHRNMLSPGHARIGLGRHAGHWTQLFGR